MGFGFPWLSCFGTLDLKPFIGWLAAEINQNGSWRKRL
jgi:hypothetical protein